MAGTTTTMFGKAYDTVGSADKNLILQTRGDLKVRWGNKYIDLIKNGKINVDVDLLKKIDNKDSIIKDGVYLVENEDHSEVWLQIGDSLINLLGEIGTTYVSYASIQEVTVDEKFTALSNIGFFYQTLEDVKKANVQKGLVYIVDQHKLFYIENGEITEYIPSFTIPDPLRVGSVTIDGKGQTVGGTNKLLLNLSNKTYLSILEDKIQVSSDIVTESALMSEDYHQGKTGYSIYFDEEKNWYCAEFDYIRVRRILEYDDIVDVRYKELRKLILTGTLIPKMRYRIIDFQNEWDINGIEVYEDHEDSSGTIYQQNIYPIVVTAKSLTKLEKEGYMDEHPEWIIEYDPDFYYYVNDFTDDKGITSQLYTKGRITKLSDEYGNVGNYDFKHRMFKYISNSDDINYWYFTFNKTNPERGTFTTKTYSSRNTRLHIDATQERDAQVKNNIINIKEPSFENRTITNNEGQSETVQAVIIYDEYIIFPDCEIIYPYDNTILESSGTYVITQKFYGNKIEGLLQTIQNPTKVEFKFDFYNNTFGKIYIKGDKYGNSAAVVVFADYKEFYNNTAKDVVRAIFFDDSHDNVFQNIDSCTFDAPMINNTFDSDLWHTAFECNTMTNNHITGYIFTDNAKESYPIKVGNLSDNVINIIYKSALNCAGYDITNNIINNIISYNISNSNLRDNIIKDIIGDDTGFNPNVNPNDVYSGQGSGTQEQTDDNGTVISVTIYEMTWYRETPVSPGSNYTLYNINYNGELFYAWLPNTITKNGTTYYLTQPASPGDGYTLSTTIQYGVTYYAWVEQGSSGGGEQGGEQSGGDESDLGTYQYSVGLLSDLHLNTDDDDASTDAGDENDLANALSVLKQQGVAFICAAGDVMETYNPFSNDSNGDTRTLADAKDFYNTYSNANSGLNFFSPLGNHDYFGLHEKRTANEDNASASVSRISEYWRAKVQAFMGSQSVTYLSGSNNLTYYFTRGDDIYVMLSLDYGGDNNGIVTSGTLPFTGSNYRDTINAKRIISVPSNDSNVNAILDYISNTNYNQTAEAQYNYQFYSPSSLIWLKNLIESNTNKKIFVFTHHFLPHKSGNSNGIPSSGYAYGSICPSASHSTTSGCENLRRGASALSGMQFWFINKLNNEHKNVYWFSGHSHLTWNYNSGDALKCAHIDNHDYNIVTPTTSDYSSDNSDPKKKTVYTKSSMSSIGNSGWWIALPSLSKPRTVSGSSASYLYTEAELSIMDVYTNGIKIKGYKSKRASGSYSLEKLVEKNLLMDGTEASGNSGGGNSGGNTGSGVNYNSSDADILKEAYKYTVNNSDDVAWESGPYIMVTVVNNTNRNMLLNGIFKFVVNGVTYKPSYRKAIPAASVEAVAQTYPKMKEWNTSNGVFYSANHHYYGNTSTQPTNFAVAKNGGSLELKCIPDTSTNYSSLNIPTNATISGWTVYTSTFGLKSDGSGDLLLHNSGVFLSNDGATSGHGTMSITSSSSNSVSVQFTITGNSNNYLLDEGTAISNTAYRCYQKTENGVSSKTFVVRNLYYFK